MPESDKITRNTIGVVNFALDRAEEAWRAGKSEEMSRADAYKYTMQSLAAAARFTALELQARKLVSASPEMAQKMGTSSMSLEQKPQTGRLLESSPESESFDPTPSTATKTEK